MNRQGDRLMRDVSKKTVFIGIIEVDGRWNNVALYCYKARKCFESRCSANEMPGHAFCGTYRYSFSYGTKCIADGSGFSGITYRSTCGVSIHIVHILWRKTCVSECFSNCTRRLDWITARCDHV